MFDGRLIPPFDLSLAHVRAKTVGVSKRSNLGMEEMIEGTKCKLSLSDSDALSMFDETTHLDVFWDEM